MGYTITVCNNTDERVECFISNFATKNGSDDWYPIEAEERDSWNRSHGGWEVVGFRNADDSVRAAKYLDVRKAVVVNFNGFEDGYIEVR